MRLGVFRALDDLGLVEIDRNRGACVRKIDLDEATESPDACSALEELAARSAARWTVRVRRPNLLICRGCRTFRSTAWAPLRTIFG
jgi:hypothetical protein